jgi:HAE1 family hydrophobic/amphiphilic exporter-1
MLKKIISSQLRVYLILAVLAFIGVIAGTKLPVSLYPNTSKPTINVSINYGGASARNFIRDFGSDFENQLKGITNTGNKVENVTGDYSAKSVSYKVDFAWGVNDKIAKKEVESIVNTAKSRLNKESADSVGVWAWNSNGGFLAISFYSDTKNLDQLYEYLNPILAPELSKISDAESATLWNPNSKEVLIRLDHQKMALLGLLPTQIYSAIETYKNSYSGSAIKVGEKNINLQINSLVNNMSDLNKILIPIGKRFVYLGEISTITYANKSNVTKIFKTNGAPSLIVWANPKGGGNVKKMSEDIIEMIKSKKDIISKDVHYRILVDPSEFIRSSINNVFKEVLLAALLAVFILYLFVGNLKNVITAAIEIPLSMVLAFIMMKVTGMNINLISLGGLAIASGMNIDASVVVLENIFRHQEIALKMGKTKLSIAESMQLIVKATREVALPVFVSMITTLVVFIPLAFTSNLTSAILGDLAKAVIFSHGFSAFVALTLVPTIRFQLLKKGKIEINKPVIDKPLKKFEKTYLSLLENILGSTKKKIALLLVPIILVIGLATIIIPSLPKEIVGKPDSDWMIVSATNRMTTSVREMENFAEEVENRALTKFGEYIRYTFVQIRSEKRGTIMLRLKDKKHMDTLWKKLEKEFDNGPGVFFWVGPWNPAELPIPNPPHLEMQVTGKDFEQTKNSTDVLKNFIKDTKIYKRTHTNPDVRAKESIVMTPYEYIWRNMKKEGVRLDFANVLEISRLMSSGKALNSIPVKGTSTPILIKYDKKFINSVDGLKSFPIRIKDKVIPLSGLVDIKRKKLTNSILRENGQEQFIVSARLERGKENESDEALATFTKEYEKNKEKLAAAGVAISFNDAQKVMTDAMSQLQVALAASLLLVFFVLLLQFQNIKNALVVMTAIPLGLIGVLISLYVFKSNLSLNSVLGIILLNGIAVNNSILLVDFSNDLYHKGMTALTAVVEASRKRLRPILITSITTILGMLPIALGMGDGGKILQPLGIAVSGGLFISTALTLVVVPTLQLYVLERTKRKVFILEDEQSVDQLESPMIDSEKVNKHLIEERIRQ